MRLILFLIWTSLSAASFSTKKGDLAPLAPSQSFSLFSLNTLFLPFPVSYFTDGMPPWPDRIDGVIAKIQEVDPDIICLQEVYSNLAARYLIKKLRSSYAVFFYDVNPKWIGLNSGLFVASKYPVENPTYRPFKS
ncbi:MAG TPA: endonuclease/exonuclease/phosphatase family protein, partial [Chlamydiales bacterium]|nr:endonuclease/exonuclease/phosphatase family protein [Chlamydiales bacterium]